MLGTFHCCRGRPHAVFARSGLHNLAGVVDYRTVVRQTGLEHGFVCEREGIVGDL
jgi:hypothetical protein